VENQHIMTKSGIVSKSGRLRWGAAGIVAAAISLSVPAQADSIAGSMPSDNSASSGASTSDSGKLLQLDLMLMVTELRCRNTADDFQADFQAFEARHLADLNAAARDILTTYMGRMGMIEANLAFDRLSVQIANQYGAGHPWLGCHDLKWLAQSLAQNDGREVLLQAASEILPGDGALPTVGQPPVIADAHVDAGAPVMADAHGNADAAVIAGAVVKADVPARADVPVIAAVHVDADASAVAVIPVGAGSPVIAKDLGDTHPAVIANAPVNGGAPAIAGAPSSPEQPVIAHR